MEFNRRSIANRSTRRSLQNKAKYFFRIPNKVALSLGFMSPLVGTVLFTANILHFTFFFL